MKNSLVGKYGFVILFLIIFFSCQKKVYYVDGGLAAQPEGDKQMLLYDYLKSRPGGAFDSVIKMIDIAGIKDLINQENITFFAPINTSIIALQNAIAFDDYDIFIFSDVGIGVPLSEISAELLRAILKRYIVKDSRIELVKAYEDRLRKYVLADGETAEIEGYRGEFRGIPGTGAYRLRYTHKKTGDDPINCFCEFQTHNLVTRNAMLHIISPDYAFLGGVKFK